MNGDIRKEKKSLVTVFFPNLNYSFYITVKPNETADFKLFSSLKWFGSDVAFIVPF